MNREASIVAQVAFKGAVEIVSSAVVQDLTSAKEAVEDLTIEFAKAIVLAGQVEELAEAFGNVEVQRAPSSPQRSAPAPQAPRQGPPAKDGDYVTKDGITVRRFNQDIGEEGLEALHGVVQCGKCGGTHVWDNRNRHPKFGGSNSPKSPYFKCANKECGQGFWAN